jgi:hypothetical protein
MTGKGLFVNKFFNAFSHSNYLFHYISRDNIIILCITGGQWFLFILMIIIIYLTVPLRIIYLWWIQVVVHWKLFFLCHRWRLQSGVGVPVSGLHTREVQQDFRSSGTNSAPLRSQHRIQVGQRARSSDKNFNPSIVDLKHRLVMLYRGPGAKKLRC